jgi:hypothetical protein
MSVYLFLLYLLSLIPQATANVDAKRLYDDLMMNYNKHRRPANRPQDAVTIKIKLRLSQIIDVVSFIKAPNCGKPR